MASLYSIKESNVLKSFLIIAFFFALISVIGLVVSVYLNSFLFFVIAVCIACGMSFYSFWGAHKTVLHSTGAREVERNQHTEKLYDVVENIAITANIPTPKIYIIDDQTPNAFATGRNPRYGVVAVTSGLLDVLNKNELEGVIAHEIAHIKNRDTLVMTIVFAFAGIIAIIADYFLFFSISHKNQNTSPVVFILIIAGIVITPFIATILKLAVSRKREYSADATAALFTRYPEGLASALEKIRDHTTQPMKKANHGVAHFFIYEPSIGNNKKQKRKNAFIQNLFSTHPPIDDRIQKLRAAL